MMQTVRKAVRTGVGRARIFAALGLRLAQVSALKVLRATDHRRWAAPQNLEPWWDERTRLLAELVPPGSRVIEFGAGRRQLERYLDPSCTYIPSDLVDRGPGTIVCDLNQRPLPDLSSQCLDVAVFGGVLEYIFDAEALVAWLAPSVTRCVASYACVEPHAGLARRLSRHIERWRNGYMSHLTEREIVSLFGDQGFVCREQRSWQGQRLFLFEKVSQH
jgi:Methyltransferase domain